MKKTALLILATALFLAGSQLLLRQNRKVLKDRTVIRLETWNVPPKSLPLERKLWDEAVKNFEESHPGIVVQGYEREYHPEEFITVMAGGKGPDLVKVWAGSVQTLAGLGFLAAVDPYIENWGQRDYIKPVLWESTRVNGKFYGIPADTHFLFLLYRKDLFIQAGLDPEKPPATWEELVTAAKALTRRSEGKYGLGLVPKTWIFQDFVWQAGGEMVRENDGKIQAAFAEEPAVRALQFWKDLRFKYDVLQPNVLMKETELMHLFALGKVAMIFGTANQLPALLVRYKLKPDTFGIAPLPAGPAGPAAHLGGDVYVVNAGSDKEHQEAAWQFIDFELSVSTQLWKWRRMHELNMVIFPGAFSSATELANQPEFKMVQDALASARAEVHAPGWPLVRDMLDADPLQQIFLEPNADPAEILLSHAKLADREYFSKIQPAAVSP